MLMINTTFGGLVLELKRLYIKYTWLFKRMFVNDLRSNMFYFALEGTILAIILNIYGNNNNLFAQRLGATDFQLSLITGIPQFVGMFLLLPAGFMVEKVKSKRSFVAISVFMVGVLYLGVAMTPFLNDAALPALILLLSLCIGFMTVYNSSWQSYFSETIPITHRNKTLTLRTRGTLFMGMLTPLITGFVLAAAKQNNTKIIIHQIFYVFIFIFCLLQIHVLFKIKEPAVIEEKVPRKFLKTMKETGSELIKSKSFLFFMAAVTLFHMSWHIDWTINFISRTKYLNLNEAMLSMDIVLSSVVQLISLKFWSKVIDRKGVRFTLIMASIGFTISSICMYFVLAIPYGFAKYIYLLYNPLSNFATATIVLCLLPCLLQVIPEKNKSITISIYTMFIVLSNAVMPIVGTTIYDRFGGDLPALRHTYLIVIGLRIIAGLVLYYRWRLLKNTPK